MKKKNLLIYISLVLILPLLGQNIGQLNNTSYMPNKPFSYTILTGVGYAHRMGKLNNEMDAQWRDFYRDLHNSMTLNMELYYCLNVRNNVKLNLGITTDFVSSIAQVYNKSFQHVGLVNKFSCHDQYFYTAPSIMFTKNLNSRITAFGGYHTGPVYYTRKEEYDEKNFMSNAIALGWGLNAGIGYNLSKNLVTGIKMKCLIVRIKSVQIDNQSIEYDDPLNASHITITAFGGFLK